MELQFSRNSLFKPTPLDDEESPVVESRLPVIKEEDEELEDRDLESSDDDDVSSSDDHDDEQEVPERCSAFTFEYINRKNRMLIWWAVSSFVFILLFTGFFAALAATHGRYMRECDEKNTFSQFSMCVMAYLILIHAKDFILAAAAIRITNPFLKNENPTLPYIDATLMNSSRVPKSRSECGATLSMGLKSARDTYKHGLINLYSHKDGTNIPSDLKESLIKISETVEKEHESLKADQKKKTGNNAWIANNNRIVIAVNTVSVITCFFWVIAGLDAIKDVAQFRKYNFDSPEIPSFCTKIYAINWSLLILTLLIAIFNTLPALLRLLIRRDDRAIRNTYRVQ